MDRETGHSPQARQFSVQDQAWGRPARRWAQRFWQNRRQVYLAIASAGLLAVAPYSISAQAQTVCASQGSADEAVCCPGDMLKAYWPGRSPQLNQTLCQLLMFPTATLANGDDFSQRIVDGSLSSDSRASADTMTLPSLWWNRDSLSARLGGRRLVDSWISYQIKDSSTPVVDMMINPQMWSVLTYNERYAVLNQFGTAARNFGYNLRFFQGNSRSYRLVGVYACEFVDLQGEPLGSDNRVRACSANLDAGLIVLLQRNLLAEVERRQQSAQTAATSL